LSDEEDYSNEAEWDQQEDDVEEEDVDLEEDFG